MHYAYMGNVTIEVIFWVKAYSVKPPTNLKTVCQIEIAVRFEYQNCKVPEIPCKLFQIQNKILQMIPT